MKKMSMKKEVLVIMMVVFMLLTVSTKVLATGTGGPISINIVAPTTNTTTVTNTTTTNTTTNNTTTTTNIVTPATTNITTSNYQNTTLPQTGDASDYAIFLLIAVVIIVAIYAYKKVREYNIK